VPADGTLRANCRPAGRDLEIAFVFAEEFAGLSDVTNEEKGEEVRFV